jgi:hypothetical protein
MNTAGVSGAPITPTLILVSGPVTNMAFAVGHLAVFQGGATSISGSIREERATRKNSQLATARRVAMKMGRRLSGRCRIGHVSI